MAQAAIVRSVPKGCPGIKESTAAYANYRLRIIKGSAEPNMPVIGVPAPLKNFARQNPSLTFHSCTSADGVHLTAWRGKALGGDRLWHEYYYLGQDLEATCTAQETAP